MCKIEHKYKSRLATHYTLFNRWENRKMKWNMYSIKHMYTMSWEDSSWYPKQYERYNIK